MVINGEEWWLMVINGEEWWLMVMNKWLMVKNGDG